MNWLLYVTIKERKLKYKTNEFLNVQWREGNIFHDQSSLCYGQSFFLFFSFFFSNGTTGIGEENCASLHVSKNRDNFQVSWTWTHSVKFPPIKQVISDCAISKKKKKKGSSRRIYSCFFTHNGIPTPKTREGQESTTKTSLHSAWPLKFKNQVLFTPRSQSRFLDLGLETYYRAKSRSLPRRVEVIQLVVRACTTFWLTSTRITLTRVHRPRRLAIVFFFFFFFFFWRGFRNPGNLCEIRPCFWMPNRHW